MSIDSVFLQSVLNVLECGLTIENKRGGYLRKVSDTCWRHQTSCRSTDDFECAEDAIESFADEMDEGEI